MSSSADRQLLGRALTHTKTAQLLDALLEWKEGAPLESTLSKHGLNDSDQTVDHRPAPPGRSASGSPGACRYTRIRPHARGGLGEVFVARDEELQREVALKEIQDYAADDAGCRARFVREAEVTGNLEHPGIVAVYGLGTYPDGRPYYAMRFIKGESLRSAVVNFHKTRQDPLALRPLLNRFVSVCNAVAFAHSRGVIHRDIKPDNVMLGDYGETLVVDWGLAKASGVASAPRATTASGGASAPREGEEADLTQGALGTPAYMPPEQAQGLVKEMGPHSDIFALGATLYAILTGRPPYKGNDVLAQATACDWKPARRIKKDVPRALEAICAKAMAQRPEDRYATARDLAQDVEAYLADEPVLAYREPVWDRMRRWTRKHRTLVTSGVAVLLVAVVGLIVGLGAVSAEQARTAEARDDALAAEKEAKDNLAIAEDNLKLARKAVNDTFDLAKNHKLLQQPGMQEVRKLLFEKALPFYKRFHVLRGDDPQGQKELADQHYRVGYITAEIGDKQEARRAYEQAEEICRALAKGNPSNREYQSALATTLTSLGLLLHAQGKGSAALVAYTQGKDIRAKLVKDNPTVTEYQGDLAGTYLNIGIVLQEQGKRAAALKAYTRARDISETLVQANPTVTEYQHALALTLTSMGVLLTEEGKRTETLAVYSRARYILATLVKANPTVTGYQNELGRVLINLGSLLQAEGKRREALRAFEQARDILATLVQANPAVPAYQNALSGSLTSMGNVLKEQGKRAEALVAYTQARNIQQKLVKDNPEVTAYQTALALALNNMGNMLAEDGKGSEALVAYTQARDIREKLVKDNPTVTAYQNDLASTLANMGLLLQEAGKRTEALKVYARARDINERLVKDHPAVTEYRNALARTLLNMGILLQVAGKGAEALQAYSQSRDIREKLVKDNPSVTVYRNDLARTLNNLAFLRRAMKQHKEALADLDVALKHLEAVLKIDPRYTPATDLLWRVLYTRAMTLDDLNRHADAAAAWGKFLPVAPAQYRTLGRLRRADCLARAGSAMEAMKEAEAVGHGAKLAAGDLYDLACIASVCAAGRDASQPLPRREHLAEGYARKAITWLQAAHKAGYFKTKANRDHLLEDADFAALRGRDDFKAWLKSLQE